MARCCDLCGATMPDPALPCVACGADATERAIARALTRALRGAPCTLASLPADGIETGLLLGPAGPLATMLEDRFACTRAGEEGDPPLDLARAADAARWLKVDFVVCLGALGRVPPPVTPACLVLASLLRPGGVLVLAERAAAIPATIEHVPGYHAAQVVALGDRRVLVNRTAAGAVETFDALDYPDGRGRPVFRRFAAAALPALLAAAGFAGITVEDQPDGDAETVMVLGASRPG
jgi:SAM-dependent methyltransferase